MTVRTTAGTTIKVSASIPATFNAAGYAAIAGGMTKISEVTNLGEFGREFALVTHNPIDNRGTVKKKGSFNEGQLALQLGFDSDDAGQLLLIAASNSDNDYSFLVTFQNGDKAYFQAQVMNFKIGAGSVDQITGATANLEITTGPNGEGVIWVYA